jgi:pyrimidine-nucleoside phosphorylase
VGDVTTLIVAPMLAAAGCQVAKLSGRGLGHTGGTLDKLESIPGMRVDLSPEQVLRQVEQIGLAVAAAGPDLVPGDRRLYALRDVTGTVGDPALIASSVMSKKIAGGADHILLDVKVGGGALVTDLEQARTLAERCVAIGSAHGRRVGALLTQMDEPWRRRSAMRWRWRPRWRCCGAIDTARARPQRGARRRHAPAHRAG